MPGNKVEDGIRNIYELDNSSQGQFLSQTVCGNWPVLDYDQWVGKSVQIETQQNFNLNFSSQQLGSVRPHGEKFIGVPFNQCHTQFTPMLEYSRSLIVNNPLNTNDFSFGCENFLSKQNQAGVFGEDTCHDQQILTSRNFSVFKSQYENESADSPTLTVNSEISDITEAASDFSFLRERQQLVADQQLCTPSQVMQQSGHKDMQLLQRHMMLKQLQELQRQQQLQQLGDLRQQNALNQVSSVTKQAAGGQLSPFINGTPVHDVSQMLRNWMQQAASPASQGVTSKVLFSQEQGQAVHSMGLPSQQPDVSLYGTPISNARSMNQYCHHQGISHDYVNILSKVSSPTQKSLTSSGMINPYLGDQSAVLSDLLGLPQGTSMSKHGLRVKNNFGQFQGPNSAFFPGNYQDATALENDCVQELNGRQELAGWPALQQTTKQCGPSQGLVPLDPIEAKILYNMDDNIWDAFGGRPDIRAGGFGNGLEHPDSSHTFPSIQSGSWSALMQSAVAEASSSDTGVQEEWSGLTFQNTEHSTDNQISNFADNEKQQTGLIDNNLQSASSFSSKPFTMVADSCMSSSFPGFQQPGVQLSIDQKENICEDQSHETMENCMPRQNTSVKEGHHFQNFDHLTSAWTGQIFDHSQSDLQHQRSDISMNKKGNEKLKKIQQQIPNGSHVVQSSYEGVSGTCEKQQSFRQRENSFYSCTSNGMSGLEKAHFEQFKFSDIASGSLMTVDEEPILDLQGNSGASEGIDSRADHCPNTSTSFHRSVLHDFSAQTSEHMLELLHKVDQTRDNGSMLQFGSGDPKTEVPGSDSCDTSASQLYTQTSASQGYGLRLAPPLQRLPNTNSFLPSQDLPQTVGSTNSIHANRQLEEKSQIWLTPLSPSQSLPSSHELSRRGQWNTKSGTSAPSGSPLYLNAQEKSVSSFTPNPLYTRNQLEVHRMSSVPPTSHPLQVRLPGAPSRYPHLAFSQGFSQQIFSNPVGQQFPVLEAKPISQPSGMSGISQQGECSASSHNLWRNEPSQRQPFDTEHHKSLSILPSPIAQLSSSLVSISGALYGSKDHNSVKYGYKSSEYGASYSQGVDYGETHFGKEMSQQQLSSKLSDSSQYVHASQGQQSASDAIALNNHQSYSHLQQVQAMNCVDVIPEVQQAAALGGQLPDNNSRIKHCMNSGPLSSTQPNSFPSRDTKLLNFSAEARDTMNVKASLQPAHQARVSQEMAKFGHNDSQTQTSGNNIISNQMDLSQINLPMSPSWFKRNGTFKNGQMVPMFDARLAETVASQLALGKQSQNLHIQTSLERLDAAQGGKVWPTTAATLGQHLVGPYLLASEATNVVASMRPKKRKIATSELLPWHKEVMQEYKRLQNISGAEQDWAQATNRLLEKVEDDSEPIEDVQPALRSKRRLILTTRLMQQLFRPAPASVFTADLTSNSDVVSYFVTRSSLADACHFAKYTRNELLVPKHDSNMNAEKHKTSQGGGGEQFLEVLKEFFDGAKKIESDFYRLDKAASVVDVRVELQELERFAVINRFAKFHVRGQIDLSGAPSGRSLKPIQQRYVTAFPIPRNLPDGVQCVSL